MRRKQFPLSIVFHFSLFLFFIFLTFRACARVNQSKKNHKQQTNKTSTKKSHLLLRRQAAAEEANNQSANNSDSCHSSPSSSFSRACRHHLCSCFTNILARYSHVILGPPNGRTRTPCRRAVNVDINGLLCFFFLSFSPFLFRFFFHGAFVPFSHLFYFFVSSYYRYHRPATLYESFVTHPLVTQTKSV